MEIYSQQVYRQKSSQNCSKTPNITNNLPLISLQLMDLMKQISHCLCINLPIFTLPLLNSDFYWKIIRRPELRAERFESCFLVWSWLNMKLFSTSVYNPGKCGSYVPNFINCCSLKYIVIVLTVITIMI